MKLEDQVVELELSKRLKELGVKQESLFYWWDGNDVNDEGYCVSRIEIEHNNNAPSNFDVYSAFTVAELGEMFPPSCSYNYMDESGWYMSVIFPLSKWNQMYPCVKEANARAKMLIYLLENKLMELPEAFKE